MLLKHKKSVLINLKKREKSLKKIIFCLIFLFITSVSVAEDEELRFTSHITAEAWTGERGSFSLQRAVGANLNTTFLLSSLNYSLLDRLEVGTIPVNYAIDEHKFNVNLKYNFWRTSTYLWSAGYNLTVFRLIDVDGNDLGADLQLHSFQIILNYFPKWTNLKFGLNYNASSADYVDDNTSNSTILLDTQSEFGMDISYPIKNKYDVTLGLGWLRELGVSVFEKRAFGFGPSFRWYRPKKLLSSPTLGLHFVPETQDFAILLSTTFY